MPYTVEMIAPYIQPLNVKEWKEVTSWIRQQPLLRAAEAAFVVPAEFRKIFFESAAKQQEELAINTVAGMEILASVEGSAKLVHVSMRRHNPKLTLEEVEREIDLTNFADLVKYVLKVNGFEPDPPALDQGKSP